MRGRNKVGIFMVTTNIERANESEQEVEEHTMLIVIWRNALISGN